MKRTDKALRSITLNYLGVFYMSYPIVVDTMYPENEKVFLDCLSKKRKERNDLRVLLLSPV